MMLQLRECKSLINSYSLSSSLPTIDVCVMNVPGDGAAGQPVKFHLHLPGLTLLCHWFYHLYCPHLYHHHLTSFNITCTHLGWGHLHISSIIVVMIILYRYHQHHQLIGISSISGHAVSGQLGHLYLHTLQLIFFVLFCCFFNLFHLHNYSLHRPDHVFIRCSCVSGCGSAGQSVQLHLHTPRLLPP